LVCPPYAKEKFEPTTRFCCRSVGTPGHRSSSIPAPLAIQQQCAAKRSELGAAPRRIEVHPEGSIVLRQALDTVGNPSSRLFGDKPNCATRTSSRAHRRRSTWRASHAIYTHGKAYPKSALVRFLPFADLPTADRRATSIATNKSADCQRPVTVVSDNQRTHFTGFSGFLAKASGDS
jgi:hypothetical protein